MWESLGYRFAGAQLRGFAGAAVIACQELDAGDGDELDDVPLGSDGGGRCWWVVGEFDGGVGSVCGDQTSEPDLMQGVGADSEVWSA